jgi:hypothetical protein
MDAEHNTLELGVVTIDGGAFTRTPAALPRLLRVKRGLLSQQFSNQFFGPIDRDLIAYREQYYLIPLNPFVEFDALIAHASPALARLGCPTL